MIELAANAGRGAWRLIIVGCKADAEPTAVTREALEDFGRRHADRCVGVFMTSAKERRGMEIRDCIVRDWLQHRVDERVAGVGEDVDEMSDDSD
jgi:hypothetical protein